MSEITCRRIYEQKEETDGFRILIDRLWPRGIKKENAGIDLWIKDIAPSSELRKWFGHDPERYTQFKEQYCAELSENPKAAEFCELAKEKLQSGNVTLLYAAKDIEHNNALVLKEWLDGKIEHI